MLTRLEMHLSAEKLQWPRWWRKLLAEVVRINLTQSPAWGTCARHQAERKLLGNSKAALCTERGCLSMVRPFQFSSTPLFHCTPYPPSLCSSSRCFPVLKGPGTSTLALPGSAIRRAIQQISARTISEIICPPEDAGITTNC